MEATIAGLDALEQRVADATRQIVADAAHLIQADSMGFAPVGVVGNSTNMPGDLRRSIDVEGPVGGDAVWMARVGPTVVYGRQRELGGPIYPQHATALAFTKFGTRLVIGPEVHPGAWDNTVYLRRPGVYQHARPYMRPGRAAALPEIEAVASERIAVAVEGG